MKHSKHSKLQKPDIGAFGRNEIAFLGTTCEQISDFVNKLISKLDKNLNISYLDADHSSEKEELTSTRIQDKISHLLIETTNRSQQLQRIALNDRDVILINGNHFEGKNQIVFIDPKKESSLKKRTEQLTNVVTIITLEDKTEIYPWLAQIVNVKHIPIINIHELVKASLIISVVIKTPPLKALILKGGKSQRMGTDKHLLEYHGISQEKYLQNELESLGIETFLSQSMPSQEINSIVDTFAGLGPYGGILSAFREDPNAAWLVLACDMPLIGKTEIQHLVEHRNTSKLGTACYNPETDFPDPLFTIWEPRAYSVLLQYLSGGYSCPRKVLINENIELLHLPEPKVLRNCNTPEEMAEIKLEIEKSS
jgi:molybdenum cofactor guanylyltransferase